MPRTEVGADAAAQLVSAACATCGWSEVFGYARPTGLPVATRLAGIKAAEHVCDADERPAEGTNPADRLPDDENGADG